MRRVFYRPIPLAALNQDPAKASAAPWVAILRRAFGVWGMSRIAIPTVGLTDLLVEPVLKYLTSGGAVIQMNQRVEKIHRNANRVTGVQTQDGKIWTADAVICALPPRIVSRLLPGLTQADRLNFSGIVSVYLWLDGDITSAYFMGLLDTHAQWFFNRPALFRLSQKKAGAIALVISGADDYMETPKDQIVKMITDDLSRTFPEFSKRKILNTVVIKEKYATLSHQPGQLRYRPTPQTTLENLYLAGDWVNTGLPATIESATASAHARAGAIAPA
jgi:protoporphyrinogen oxidase